MSILMYGVGKIELLVALKPKNEYKIILKI